MTAFANTPPAREYVPPFMQGLEAAERGVPWTACPYRKESEQYERAEWLRGHLSHEAFNDRRTR